MIYVRGSHNHLNCDFCENIGLTGTVGLLLRYYRGNLQEGKKALDELLAQGFRLSKAVNT